MNSEKTWAPPGRLEHPTVDLEERFSSNKNATKIGVFTRVQTEGNGSGNATTTPRSNQAHGRAANDPCAESPGLRSVLDELDAATAEHHRHTRHNRARSAEYGAWANAVARCHKPAHHDFDRYGARGITVCDEWRDHEHGFERFYAHIGPRPGRGYSIENKELGNE